MHVAANDTSRPGDPRKWVRIYRELREEILLGALEPGDPVSCQPEGKDRDAVDGTVHRACLQLADDGWLFRPPRRGTPFIVAPLPPDAGSTPGFKEAEAALRIGRCGDCGYLYSSRGHIAECGIPGWSEELSRRTREGKEG